MEKNSIYEFIIFNRQGLCLFHLDFTKTIDFTNEKATMQR